MRPWLLIILVFFAFPPSVNAGGFSAWFCQWRLKARNGFGATRDHAFLVENLPALSQLEIPAEAGRRLRDAAGSELRQWLRGMTVDIMGFRPGGPYHPAALGEGVQSYFVASALRAIQPRTQIVAEDAPATSSSRRTLMLHDPWQGTALRPSSGLDATSRWRELVRYHALAMPLLKAANALFSALPSRRQLRQIAGLNPDLKILSVYTFRANFDAEKFRSVLTALQRAGLFDVIIVSDSRTQDFHGFPVAPSGTRTWLLSQVKGSDLNSAPAGTLVLNDTLGYLPQINALSNMTFVNGPVDFIGPLQSGTPVLVMNDEESLRRFHRDGYRALRVLAEQTGAAEFIEHPEDIHGEVIRRLMTLRPFRRPHELQVVPGATPLDLLARALQIQFLGR